MKIQKMRSSPWAEAMVIAKIEYEEGGPRIAGLVAHNRVIGEIDTIARGFAEGGESNSALEPT